MASAKISSSRPIDLRSQATYTVRLGKSIQHGSKQRYAAVQYNHKPQIVHAEDTTLSIVPDKKSGRTMMSLKDGDEEYEYHGRSAEDTDTFVLIRDDKTDGFVLERLVASHIYNLTSAPWETNQKKLSQQYPEIDISEAGRGPVTEDLGDDECEADPENPFDFRNHVTSFGSISPALGRSQRSTAIDHVTVSQPSSRQGTPSVKPIQKPGSAFPVQQKPHTAKAVVGKDRRRADAPAAPVKPVPSINLERHDTGEKDIDRKASASKALAKAKSRRKSSVHDISMDVDDADDLVMDGADHRTTRQGQPKKSLGIALSGQLNAGPISLRSAASSPGSTVNSPAPTSLGLSGLRRGRWRDETGEEQQPRDEDGEATAEADHDVHMHDADGDVEDLTLPSPAQTQMHRTSTGGSVVNADDDDELEKQMLEAMLVEDPDEGSGHNATHQDEEEESEEE